MHISRKLILITGCLGMASSLFTWRLHDVASEAGLSAFAKNHELVQENGIDTKMGFVTLVLFALVMIISIMGKRKEPLQTGSKKFALLVINASLVIYHVVVISIVMLQAHKDPAYGLYTAASLSFISLVIPYLFKKSGEFGAPSAKEIVEDIEESAEKFEDSVENVGDHIEESVDGAFQKKEDPPADQ